jgi:hypothetical protein
VYLEAGEGIGGYIQPFIQALKGKHADLVEKYNIRTDMVYLRTSHENNEYIICYGQKGKRDWPWACFVCQNNTFDEDFYPNLANDMRAILKAADKAKGLNFNKDYVFDQQKFLTSTNPPTPLDHVIQDHIVAKMCKEVQFCDDECKPFTPKPKDFYKLVESDEATCTFFSKKENGEYSTMAVNMFGYPKDNIFILKRSDNVSEHTNIVEKSTSGESAKKEEIDENKKKVEDLEEQQINDSAANARGADVAGGDGGAGDNDQEGTKKGTGTTTSAAILVQVPAAKIAAAGTPPNDDASVKPPKGLAKGGGRNSKRIAATVTK